MDSEEVTVDVRVIVKEAHANAVRKGWHDGKNINPDRVLALLALVASEIGEAVEDVRDWSLGLAYDENGKPCGLPSELADVVIRVADMCGLLGIDLNEAISAKMEYNATREHKHGRFA